MKSKRRLGICLAVGILVLAVSAAAAFGSVNGYARYKQAVKDLLLREDNFTVQAQTHLSVDGERLLSVQMDYAKAGLNSAYHSREDHGGESHQEYRTVLDGVRTRFAGDSSFYSCESIERGEAFSNLLGYDVDNEMERRLVDFAETAVDLVLGELKNNVVQLGTEGDETIYQVRVARSQIPTLLNAGLSLFVYDNVGVPVSRFLTYEDEIGLLFQRYEAVTGETLPEEFRAKYASGDYDDAWYQANRRLIERLDTFSTDWNAPYWTLFEKKDQGVLYVKADGSVQDYDTVQAFLTDHPEQKYHYLEYYMGGSAALCDVVCTFRVNGAGKLTANQIQASPCQLEAHGQRRRKPRHADGPGPDHNRLWHHHRGSPGCGGPGDAFLIPSSLSF